MTTVAMESIGTAIHVFDDVLVDAAEYRREALALEYGDVPAGDDVFRGIATFPGQMEVAQRVIDQHFPGKRVTLSFFRKSPEGQEEPNYIHSDREMGDWTAILYLNPDPPASDGTSFWMRRRDGQISGDFDQEEARDLAQWERWEHVDARFGRLLIFKSDLFHSRGIEQNYGAGYEARLIQVAFLRDAPPTGETVIRHAMPADVPQIVEMGLRFLRSTVYRDRLAESPVSMERIAMQLIGGAGALLVAERGGLLVGMIGVLLFEHPLSGEWIAGELFWWSEQPRAGMRLLREAEAWARASGAAALQMIAPTTQVERVYQARGFAQIEVAYQKRFERS
jgi:hypothetical protein